MKELSIRSELRLLKRAKEFMAIGGTRAVYKLSNRRVLKIAFTDGWEKPRVVYGDFYEKIGETHEKFIFVNTEKDYEVIGNIHENGDLLK